MSYINMAFFGNIGKSGYLKNSSGVHTPVASSNLANAALLGIEMPANAASILSDTDNIAAFKIFMSFSYSAKNPPFSEKHGS